MNKILVPIDGSECSMHALQTAIAMAGLRQDTELHLLTVVLPIVSGHAKMFLDQKVVEDYYNEEGGKALAGAKIAAEKSEVKFVATIKVGQSAQTIADFARERQCSQIVMGTRGLSALPGILLGSVASKVIHLADVPVTLVK